MYTAGAIVRGNDFLGGGASEGLAMAMARDALAAARADFRRLAAPRTGTADEGPFMARVQADPGVAQWAGRGPWEAPGSRARRDYPQAPRRTLALPVVAGGGAQAGAGMAVPQSQPAPRVAARLELLSQYGQA